MTNRETNDKGQKRKGVGGLGRNKGDIGRYKVVFWNVAGMRNKDEEFWKGLEEWEVVVMSETWVEEREWEYIRGRLPKDYVWEKQWARRESKKGKAIGDDNGGEKGDRNRAGGRRGREGLIMRKLKLGGEWMVIGIM